MITEFSRPRPEAKWRRVMSALIARPYLDRRIAANDPSIGDTCLNTTISEIAKKGLRIDRTLVRRTGFQGEPVWLAEYRLPACERETAQRILASAGRRRGPAS